MIKHVFSTVASLFLAVSLFYTERAFGAMPFSFQPGQVAFASQSTFIFNPRTHRYDALNANGHVVRSGRASGGRNYCPDVHRSCRTPTGVYYVHSKGGPSCRSSRYPVGHGGAPMPYCMFFSHYYAVHGSPDVPNRNASHGCIRVRPGDAYWLNKNFMHVGTKVIIKPY